MWAASVDSEHVGQVMMIGFSGTALNSQVREMIELHRVGSIMLNASNVENAAQVRRLTTSLQQVARDAGHTQPLLIAVDQEGGMLATIRDRAEITQFPGAMALASASSAESLIYEVSKAAAQELLTLGINWVLGPVLDILSNPLNTLLGVRAFGRTAQDVAKFGASCAAGLRAAGVINCGKHFPGYGNAQVGSMTGLPLINETLAQLDDNFVPYRELINRQLLDSVLIGGAVLPQITKHLSACLSPKIVKEVLRDKLHFQGVLVSECLQMEKISHDIGIPQAAILAISAGCDILLNCHNRKWQIEVIATLKIALDRGLLSREVLESASTRVSQLKSRFLSWDRCLGQLDMLSPAQHEHNIELAKTAYSECVYLLRDQGGLLPVSKWTHSKPLLLLTPLVLDFGLQSQAFNDDEDVLSEELAFQFFGRALGKYAQVIHTSYTSNGVSKEIENLVDTAGAVLIVSADGLRNLYQISFAKHLSMLCKYKGVPVGAVAVSNPYDFYDEPTISTYIVTHEMTEHALLELVPLLMGIRSERRPRPALEANDMRKESVSAASGRCIVERRPRWLIEPLLETGRVVDSLFRTHFCAAYAEQFGVKTLKDVLQRDDVDVCFVQNLSTKEVYGLSVMISDRVLMLAVVPQRRLMFIGYSLLHECITRATTKGFARLCFRCSTAEAQDKQLGFLQHLGVQPSQLETGEFAFDIRNVVLA